MSQRYRWLRFLHHSLQKLSPFKGRKQILNRLYLRYPSVLVYKSYPRLGDGNISSLFSGNINLASLPDKGTETLSYTQNRHLRILSFTKTYPDKGTETLLHYHLHIVEIQFTKAIPVQRTETFALYFILSQPYSYSTGLQKLSPLRGRKQLLSKACVSTLLAVCKSYPRQGDGNTNHFFLTMVSFRLQKLTPIMGRKRIRNYSPAYRYGQFTKAYPVNCTPPFSTLKIRY